MKITAIETLRADAGWRMFSFLKISTSSGAIGWSEFSESFGSTGLADVITGGFQDLQVVLAVVGDDLDVRIGQDRLELGLHEIGADFAPAGMFDRRVEAFRCTDGDCDPDEIRAHRIERGRFDIERDHARLLSPRDEMIEVRLGVDDRAN